MTDQDRGAYTPPTDAPLSFDARKPVRGSRPVPLTLIVSGLVLVLLVAAIVVFYRSGVRQAGQAPATVGEPVGPMKAAAPPEAQPTDPAAGLQIYKADGTEPPAPTFTPPPEAPQTRTSPPPAPPIQTAQIPPASTAAGLKPAQPAPKTAPPPAPKAARPPATAAPAPVVVAKAPPPPAPKAPPPAPPAPVAGGPGVQIGAFSSQALADKGYAEAGRIAGVDIAGKSKRVERVERNGATLFRTTVVGFASRGEAQAFCNELKAAGKSCFVK